MTEQEVDILLMPESRQTLRRYLDCDPVQAALQLKAHRVLLATQLKYLQRARHKLPSYYRAECILPPLAFEQASSEAAAAAKQYSGALCIDLTCGLGVDTYHFSKHFERVISIERDPVTARVAASNFARLGVHNVEVINDSAEHFIARYDGMADLIYVDPARRGEGNCKLFRLEDCSPDMLALTPKLVHKTKKLVVKNSPLFDVQEAFRLFGKAITVEVVSLQGECKEVLVEIDFERTEDAAGRVRATMAGCGSLTFENGEEATADLSFAGSYRYLLIPDVSLCKSRLVRRYAARIGCYAVSESGYCLSEQLPEVFFGRIHPLREMLPYHPKQLRKYLKTKGIKRSNLLKKEFPLGVDALAKALGIGQGGSDAIAFTRIEGALYALILDPVQQEFLPSEN